MRDRTLIMQKHHENKNKTTPTTGKPRTNWTSIFLTLFRSIKLGKIIDYDYANNIEIVLLKIKDYLFLHFEVLLVTNRLKHGQQNWNGFSE